MTLEEFLVELKDTGLEAKLTPFGRVRLGELQNFCPVTAVCHKLDMHHSIGDVSFAAMDLNIDPLTMSKIVDAADNPPVYLRSDHTKRLRKRILKALGL